MLMLMLIEELEMVDHPFQPDWSLRHRTLSHLEDQNAPLTVYQSSLLPYKKRDKNMKKNIHACGTSKCSDSLT